MAKRLGICKYNRIYEGRYEIENFKEKFVTLWSIWFANSIHPICHKRNIYVWEKNWIIYSISIVYIFGKNDVRYIHTCSGPKWGLIAKIWTNFKLLEIIPAPNKPSEIKNGSLI